MSATFPTADRITPARKSGWRELWLKEDWWAVWLGLALVIVAFALFAGGSSIAWIAVAPAKWSTFSELGGQLLANAARYFAQFGFFLVIFTVATSAMGHRARNFIPSFFLIYLLSLAVFAVGAWDQAQRYNLEPPLVALLIGLLIANLTSLPRWLDTAFRVEFYIKTGIVLLGATMPFTLIIWARPVAILQASIVSIVTFLVIFFVGFLLAILSVTRWEKSESGHKVEAGQIWWRFPKFVIGFLIASIVVTWAVGSGSYGDFNKIVKPALVAPITALRPWAFTFCFFSIGLTTRLREFAPTGSRPFVAFTAGVIVNVILGFILSVLIFGHYWATLSH